MRRSTTHLAILLAPLACVAAPKAVLAVGMTSPTVYRLKNGTDHPLDHVFLGFVPNGAIVSPDANGQESALKIVGQSADYNPIAPINAAVIDFRKTADSPPEQALGLDFQGTNFAWLTGGNNANPPTPTVENTLQPGQFVDFTLNLRSLSDQLQWSFIDPPATSGLEFGARPDEPVNPDPIGPTTPTNPGAEVPEPLPLVLWSALTLLALVRAQVYRRSIRLVA
ncbi:MAG: hypothetical protein ABI353_09225 [Isosphaeraceae bacterium]